MYYPEYEDEDEWFDEFEQRVGKQKHRHFKSDDENSKICAIVDCTEKAIRGVYVTLRGELQYKRYCNSHASDQSQAERMYELGL